MATTKVTSSVIADNAVGIDQLNVSDGSSGQALTTNGSGTLSFSTISGGGTPDDDSVSTAKIQNDAVTDAKTEFKNLEFTSDGSAGYTNSSILLPATQSGIRGSGVYMHNTASDTEWYAGRPYNNSVTVPDNSYGLFYQSTAAHADGTADSTLVKWNIDPGGRVTAPSQPMVYARETATVTGGSLHSYNLSGSDYIRAMSFSHVDVNVGSHFSNTTGLFTCPVAGRYIAVMTIAYWATSGASWRGIYGYKNTTRLVTRWTNQANSYESAVCIMAASAAANDTLWFGWYNDVGGSYYSPYAGDTGDYNNLFITLLT